MPDIIVLFCKVTFLFVPGFFFPGQLLVSDIFKNFAENLSFPVVELDQFKCHVFLHLTGS